MSLQSGPFQRVPILLGPAPRHTSEQSDDNAQDDECDPGKDYRSPEEEDDDSEKRYGWSGSRTPERPVGIALNQEAAQGGHHQAGQSSPPGSTQLS